MTHEGRESSLPREVITLNNLKQHVNVLSNQIGARSVFVPGSLGSSFTYLSSQFSGMGFNPRIESFSAPEYIESEYQGTHSVEIGRGNIFSNIFIEIKGTELPNEIVTVGAHYDTHKEEGKTNPGANDNASGVAVMLEAARMSVLKPGKRTRRFVGFVNEEYPFTYTSWQGSAEHASRAYQRREQINMVVVLDGVGWIEEGDPKKDFLACVGYGPHLDKIVDAYDKLSSVSEVAVKLRVSGYDEYSGLVFPEDSNHARSDNFPFIAYGYPAMLLTDTAEFRSPHYHGGGDTIGALNFGAMVKEVDAITKLACMLANE